MKKLVLLAGIVFASGCGSSADDVLSKMESFKNKMCECKDAACADAVEKEMSEWGASMKDKIKDIEKDVSDAQKEKGKALRKEMRECRRNAKKEGGDAPKEGGDAPK